MPMTLSRPLRGTLLVAGAAFISSLFAVDAGASKPVDLRVVAPTGAGLTDQVQYTGSTQVKTDRKADSFGDGNEGSGRRARIRGATPLGAVVDAAAVERRLRPLSLTDAFDFGLGVCGIGGFDFEAGDTAFWYYKVNHVNPQVGADQIKIDPGDEVLWYLTPSFETLPPELELEAPAVTKPGQAFNVRVLQYADDGTRSPAAGVAVTGAAEPTAANGMTSVTLDGSGEIAATRSADGAIPDYGQVCVSDETSDCPKETGRLVGGSRKRDRMVGTKGPDRLAARGSRDSVDARDGVGDRVNCGGGRDAAEVDPEDVVTGSERVTR
jgi:hypothetical protein